MAAAPALEKVAECGVGGGYPLGQEVGPVFRLGVAYQSVFGLSNGGFVKYFFCNRFICYFFLSNILLNFCRFVPRCPVLRCPVRRCPVRRCPVLRCTRMYEAKLVFDSVCSVRAVLS